MDQALAESDVLVDELIRADLIIAGVPMYNFNVPAQFKAYIDNVVRVGRTFGFDRSRPGEPYWPILTDKPRPLILISSRGDFGYEDGPNALMNHVEPSVRTAFAYIGIATSARLRSNTMSSRMHGLVRPYFRQSSGSIRWLIVYSAPRHLVHDVEHRPQDFLVTQGAVVQPVELSH
jgi:multimeric flavodoxin WrbA